jgi:archaellum component FlaC
MSSAANVFKSLSANNTSQQVKTEKLLIDVPQKCYAFITPETDKSIHGLFTSGLNTCSGIVLLAHDESKKYFFLCHADPHTDLSDQLHGLSGWLQKIPNTINKVEIQFDNVHDSYGNKIHEVINKINSEEKTHNLVVTPIENASTDIVIKRDGTVIREGGIHFELLDNGYESLESDISENIADLVEFSDIANSPICIFNGKKILHTEEIAKLQPWVNDVLATAKYTKDQINEFGNDNDQRNQLGLQR